MANDHGHSHDHDDGHDHGDGHEDPVIDPVQLRVRALETILVEKGYIESGALDAIVDYFESSVGPHVGARAVARAWLDEVFKRALLKDGATAIQSIGLVPKVGDDLIVVENTPSRHNMVVCTLCSCYPWDVLGLPPAWYKSAAYRSRVVIEPRAVLTEFGVTLPQSTEIRVWDSTAETRYLVLPMRPEHTESLSEDELVALVTRNSMIGTALPGLAGGKARE